MATFFNFDLLAPEDGTGTGGSSGGTATAQPIAPPPQPTDTTPSTAPTGTSQPTSSGSGSDTGFRFGDPSQLTASDLHPGRVTLTSAPDTSTGTTTPGTYQIFDPTASTSSGGTINTGGGTTGPNIGTDAQGNADTINRLIDLVASQYAGAGSIHGGGGAPSSFVSAPLAGSSSGNTSRGPLLFVLVLVIAVGAYWYYHHKKRKTQAA